MRRFRTTQSPPTWGFFLNFYDLEPGVGGFSPPAASLGGFLLVDVTPSTCYGAELCHCIGAE